MVSSQSTAKTKSRGRRGRETGSAEGARPAGRRTRLWFVLAGVAVILILLAVFGRSTYRDYAIGQAVDALERRDYDTAEIWVERAKMVSPDDAEAEFYLARIYRKTGEFRAFEQALARARSGGYSRERCRREEWMMQAQSGQINEVIEHRQEMLDDEFGDSAEVAEAFASGYLLMGRYAEANMFLEAWQDDFPDDPQPKFMYGSMFMHNGQLEEAEEYFRSALELQPDHVPAKLALGDLMSASLEFEEAEELYRSCLDTPRHRLEALSRLGNCLRRMGELDEAREVLLKALAIDAKHYDSLLALGQVELQRQDYRAALTHLEEAVKQRRNNPEVRGFLATALRGVGRTEEAEEHSAYAEEASRELARAGDLSRNLLDDESDVAIRVEVGRIVLQYGSEQEGLVWLNSALQIDPTFVPAHLVLAEHFDRKAVEDSMFADLAAYHRQVAESITQQQPNGATLGPGSG